MTWTLLGLPLGTLLGLGAGLGSVVVGLYFLRVRRRRVQVPFIELLSELVLTQKKAAFRSRLTRIFSLLLQLLLLLLLLLALGDPRPRRDVTEARSLVLLLDVSASMATSEGETTRLERARARAEELVRGLAQDDQMLLVEMGARARPLLGWTRERAALERELKQLTVLDTSADLGAALALARDALADRPGAEIVVLSDGALDTGSAESQELDGIELSFEPVASADQALDGLHNVALATFAARRYPKSRGGFEVLYAVLNAGPAEVEVEVVIRAAAEDGQPGSVLELRRLLVPAGQTVQHSSADLSGAEGRLIAQIRRLDGREDALLRDNVAYALLPPERSVRVLVVGEANTFVDAALLIDASLTVERIAPSAYPPRQAFDVTVFEAVAPSRAPHTGAAIYLGVPRGADQEHHFPVPLGKELSSFGFDHWDKAHAVFRFFDPYDIQVLTGRALVPDPADRVLGRSEGGALLVSGERSAGRFLALGFEPRDSDFVLRVAFPLFLRNAIDALLPEQAETRVSALSTGELWRFTVPGLERGRAVVRGPLPHAKNEIQVPVEAEQAVLFAQRAGFYEVEGGDRPVALAASLLSSEESSLAPRAELVLGGRKAPPVAGLLPEDRREPWLWIVLCVLGISLVEWLTYHRRWTV